MASENPTKTNLSWYPRYPGDFMRDTGHLSLAEDGAYNRLLDHYYSTRRGLPESIDGLIRICRAFTPDEQEAVRNVADQFFPLDEDGLRRNKRADVEIAKQAQKSEAARRSIEARWNKERNTDVIRTNNEGTYERNTIHNHNHNHNQIPESEPKSATTPLGFETFWEAYPKKTGRKAAIKAWVAAKDKPDVDRIVSVVQREKQSAQWKKDGGQFIPHPATWLNQGRWDDAAPAVTPSHYPVNHIKNPRERMMAQ